MTVIEREKEKMTLKYDLGPIFNGQMLTTHNKVQLHSPYDNHHFADLAFADNHLIEQAIETCAKGFNVTKKLQAFKRYEILNNVAKLLKRDRELLAYGITMESSKPITAAFAEVDRAIFTFEVAAEESRRIHGEIIDLSWLPGNDNRQAHKIRVPRGLIVGITPFNFPLNLVAHKIAPAMAAGNTIIIKPATQTAMTAIRLGQIIIEAGWPAEGLAIIPCEVNDAKMLVTDDRVKFLTFTGSPLVGWQLKSQVGKKPITLELGGNAGNIIEADANIEYAINRVIWGGFSNAGQACISVQRVYIQESIYHEVKQKLIERVKAISFGDPWNEDTVVGPVINQNTVNRVKDALENAMSHGAKLLAGGTFENLVISPTLVESENENLAISQSELFAPVVVITPYKKFEDALERVNQSDYGLQAGLFTKDIAKIQQAIEILEVGGVNINDVSTFRIDHMPYGGVKDSGFGREGIQNAIEEMTEAKLVTYNHSVY